jgi:hypothetical protein
MRRTFLVPLVVLPLLAGCAHSQTLPVLPHGNYRYSGAVGGQPVSGVIELGEYVRVNGTSGQCESVQSVADQYVRASNGRRLEVGCGMRILLEWDSEGQVRPLARVTASRTRDEVQRGECLVWNEVNGRRTTCAGYSEKVVSITTPVTGTVTVEPLQ